jgi:hypothetical protein
MGFSGSALRTLLTVFRLAVFSGKSLSSAGYVRVVITVTKTVQKSHAMPPVSIAA